jgi:GABA(A) receptor-associated protein
MFKYKTEYSFEQRRKESAKIRAKYQERCPVIVEVNPQSDLPALDKRKFLVTMDMTLGQFLFIICKRMKIPPEKGVFLFINKKLISTGTLMSHIYREEKEEDGFLYCLVTGEDTFGAK